MFSDKQFIFEANFKANSQNLKETEDVQHYFISLLNKTGFKKQEFLRTTTFNKFIIF